MFKDIGGGDLVTYDAAADRFLVAAPDDVPAAVGVFGGNPIRYIAKARAPGHGNSAALDEQHGTVYTPDTRAGKAGLMAFDLPNGEPLPKNGVQPQVHASDNPKTARDEALPVALQTLLQKLK